MASPFAGMTGVLGAIFGAPVTCTKRGQSPVAVQAIFREEPILLSGEDGRDIWTNTATLKLRRDLLLLERGDQVTVPDGRVFKIKNGIPSGSPAADAHMIYELEVSV